ncbi:uncharacterized protein PHA67_004569 [Liasis olivaceus]
MFPTTGDWQQLDAHFPRAAPIYFLLCLGTLLLFLALAFTLFRRAKRSCGGSIPTPAAFFQPLYLAHDGNFKGWAGLAAAAAAATPEDEAGWRRGGGEAEAAAVSQLSFLQPSRCPSPGLPKRRASQPGGGAWGEELRAVPGARAVPGEPERPPCPPGDYCTLGGGEALSPAGWPPRPPPPAPAEPGARSGALRAGAPGPLPRRLPAQPGALRSEGRAEEPPESRPGARAGLGEPGRSVPGFAAGEARPLQPRAGGTLSGAVVSRPRDGDSGPRVWNRREGFAPGSSSRFAELGLA